LSSPINNILENIERPYYFGIGGIGDFLLLMSTFYDDIEDGEVDVVFVCNNMNAIPRLVRHPKVVEYPARNYFPKVNRFWFFPRNSFSFEVPVWQDMQQDERLRGTGVTPKAFNYFHDWNECGKTDVFTHYGVRRKLDAICQQPTGGGNAPIVIQPFGGADDPTKVKQLSKILLYQLVNKHFRGQPITFIGSLEDMKVMRELGWGDRDESAEIRYEVDIKEALHHIRCCEHFIGADSWGKTAAALSGLKRIDVYKNKYLDKTPQEMFGQDTDPGDYVFLQNWGFNLLEDPEIV
jgi:hypothetical protein